MKSSKPSPKSTKFPDTKKLSKVSRSLSKGIASRPLPSNAGSAEKMKHALCEQFVIYANNTQLSNRALAKKLGINESLTSKILHYHYDEFTVDRLATYLEKLYKHIRFTIDVA